MTKLRQWRWLAAMVITTTLASWLVASNHCALAAMKVAADSELQHACCHAGNDRPVEAPPTHIQCCKALNAPIPSALAAPIVHWSEHKPAWSEELVEISAAPFLPAQDYFFDTGPPGTVSFALLVLNRSLLANAPPVFVA